MNWKTATLAELMYLARNHSKYYRVKALIELMERLGEYENWG